MDGDEKKQRKQNIINFNPNQNDNQVLKVTASVADPTSAPFQIIKLRKAHHYWHHPTSQLGRVQHTKQQRETVTIGTSRTVAQKTLTPALGVLALALDDDVSPPLDDFGD